MEKFKNFALNLAKYIFRTVASVVGGTLSVAVYVVCGLLDWTVYGDPSSQNGFYGDVCARVNDVLNDLGY